MIRLVAIIFLLLSAPTIFFAEENKKTLADIRQDLNILYVEVLKLRRELSTTQSASMTTNNEVSVLERLDGMEQELRRLTSETENLEFRINSIVSDGINRVRDLEYRLVELEGGDVSEIDFATTLGGDLEISPEKTVEENSGPELAIGEKADYENAQNALLEERFEDSLVLFERFLENYPDSSLKSAQTVPKSLQNAPLIKHFAHFHNQLFLQLPIQAQNFLQQFSPEKFLNHLRVLWQNQFHLHRPLPIPPNDIQDLAPC